MAKFTNGVHSPVIGKLANTTSYIRKGEAIIRTRPKGKKVPLAKRTKQQLSTSVVHEFLRPMQEFLKFGFAYDVSLRPTCNYYNFAFRMAKQAIIGEHPKWKIDYSNVLVAKGPLPLPKNIQYEMVPEGVKFTWDTDKPELPAKFSDLAMVIAFYPGEDRADFIRSAAYRLAGEQILPLGVKNKPMELYIAFISDDHKLVSNSYHLGQAIWDGQG